MESNFCDHLTRLHDAGVISNEEFHAALDWKNPQDKPTRRGRLVFRLAVATTVALLAFLLVFLDASFPVWLTTGAVILAVAMLAPLAINDSDE